MANEIEVKFLMLIREDSIIPVTTDLVDIEQYYLSISKEREERMRRVTNPLTGESLFFKTVKEGQGLVRTEIETPVGRQEYELLRNMRVGNILTKIRRKYPFDSMMTLEFDTYFPVVEDDSSLYIAEIELRYEAHRQRAAEEIDKFCQEHRWNCVDVTENASYKAKNLALHGFPKL